MNDEFITEAIENDRYLKAARLTDQFEEEIARELRNFLKDTIEQRPDLFEDDASPSKSQTSVRTEPLAHTRMQAKMSRLNSDGDRLKFYVSIEWTQPEIHSQESEGALCLVLYKIKNLARPEYDRVKQQTQSDPEWDEIQYSDDVWNYDSGIFYIPVTDAHEVKQGLQRLQEHFFAFGEAFGVEPDLA
ncbi:hypothetical protein OB920_18595 [Halobacteria archaeon HArc-gm2]|nr:hypothetical protein [Halobacteria archaeon HArc-gm2]